MKSIRFIMIICALAVISAAGAALSADNDKARRYLEIEKQGLQWYEGVFGSSGYRGHRLEDLLAGYIGKEIETQYDYVYLEPYETGTSVMKCTFYYASWLHIKTDISRDVVKKYIADSVKSDHGNSFKSGRMISINGRLRDYKLDISFTGKRLILIIDKITLSEKKM